MTRRCTPRSVVGWRTGCGRPGAGDRADPCGKAEFHRTLPTGVLASNRRNAPDRERGELGVVRGAVDMKRAARRNVLSGGRIISALAVVCGLTLATGALSQPASAAAKSPVVIGDL